MVDMVPPGEVPPEPVPSPPLPPALLGVKEIARRAAAAEEGELTGVVGTVDMIVFFGC
jgi:hypothetical protein